jgi:PHP family Zn ribbon phosphoesterase
MLYTSLIAQVGSELDVLLRISLQEIEKVGGERVAEGIAKVRSGNIVIEPGYDGVFGKINIYSPEERAVIDKKPKQAKLFL